MLIWIWASEHAQDILKFSTDFSLNILTKYIPIKKRVFQKDGISNRKNSLVEMSFRDFRHWIVLVHIIHSAYDTNNKISYVLSSWKILLRW